MQLDYVSACNVYNALPKSIKTPHHNPDYVIVDAMRDTSLEPVFFIYQENGDTFYSAMHKGSVEGTNLFDIQSPYGYGGPIVSTDNKHFLLNAWNAYTEWCMDNDVLVEFIRFQPLLQNWKYYDGVVLDNRETVWINLEQNDLMSCYRPRVRTYIRKAMNNGLEVNWYNGDQFMDLFVPLYYQEMLELEAEEFYFFPKEYFAVIAKWVNARFAVCYLNKQILAASIFLLDGYGMEYHLSAANSEGKRLRATYLIIHEAATMGKMLGCKSLHLGGGTDTQTDNSLLFFKSGFSQNRAFYKIGRKIYREKEYQRLKLIWETTKHVKSNRTLFYRK